MRLQDIIFKFTELKNVKIYVSSYFKVDKESNIIYPDQIAKGKEITLEMYNDTFIYMVPTNKDSNLMQLKFEIL